LKNTKKCKTCNGTGVFNEKAGYTVLLFVVPSDLVHGIEEEIDRIDMLGEFTTKNANVRRGLALHYMAILSAQTPSESLM